jgi:hypothetical protein
VHLSSSAAGTAPLQEVVALTVTAAQNSSSRPVSLFTTPRWHGISCKKVVEIFPERVSVRSSQQVPASVRGGALISGIPRNCWITRISAPLDPMKAGWRTMW